eukprot:TRINITY_DN30830_c0_g1_i1.p1 TRINITY_DN30830_c0_g1~~TRINITY_DN30830_c0_g1_i1.p1  ORF type:complete len:931 (+),score=194.14 TRINITY_DN30830_c0_g1_i1:107-2899(+)
MASSFASGAAAGQGEIPPPPAGWSSFIGGEEKSVERGGLLGDEKLARVVGTAASTAAPGSMAHGLTTESWRAASSSLGGGGGLGATQASTLDQSMPSPAPLSTAEHSLKRPQTPLMAFVDRASFPGYYDVDEYDGNAQLSPGFRDWQATSSTIQAPAVVAPMATTASSSTAGQKQQQQHQQTDDEWEAELLAWKRRYGCPDAVGTDDARKEAMATPTARAAGGRAGREVQKPDETLLAAAIATVAMSAPLHASHPPSTAPARDSALITAVPQIRQIQHLPASAPSTALGTHVSAPVAPSDPQPSPAAPQSSEPIRDTSTPPMTDKQISSADDHAMEFTFKAPSALPDQTHPSTASPGYPPAAEEPAEQLPQHEAQGGAREEEIHTETADILRLHTATLPVVPFAPTPPLGTPSDRPGSRRGRLQVSNALAEVAASPKPGRKEMYTSQDMEVATSNARNKAASSGGWTSDFSELGLQARDFLMDLRKAREREKGRQASGPVWLHLAAQAKNMADKLNLDNLLEAFKLFCSVRYEDYELYMRLLGEVPHYVKQATAVQLCQLIRLLARRRLRERNYVDMVVASLLGKIRVTDDTLAARLLVKTANALAALECRSQPKFVEHFNRHLEHRIEELDAELCCMVSPVFVANYMTDSLRRSYLKRSAETHAGFQGPDYELRNLACTELVLRKEFHSFVASLPPFVCRYLEKVKAHAEFDKWGSVALPTPVAPDGPKGNEKEELNLSLLRKASTATGGRSGDVFSSDMHRDVSACLTHLGIEHENGVASGPLLIDVVAKDMVNPARHIIYEVNAPHHFYEGTQALVADKRLRHRMLNRLGWKLHMINAADWRPLTAAAKMTYILKLQQEQQDKHSDEYKRDAAANALRAPHLPSIRLDSAKQAEPFKLKSVKDYSAPITVPVPPSLRRNQRAPMTAR